MPPGAAARSSAGGLTLLPFRGVRYAPDRVSGLAEVTSPPYDVIGHDIEDELIAADPHNVVRLILPRHLPGQPGGKYDDAARTLRDWQAERILLPDPTPALYVYEQAVTSAGQPGAVAVLQRGLIGALGLVPADAGIVLPHEDVAPGPVAGRRQLMETTGANLEPIFLLYDGATGRTRQIINESVAGRPLVEAVTADGMRHRLWSITGQVDLAAIAADLAPRRALIGDGHHRYAAYLQLQRRKRAAGLGSGPWDCGLALLVDSAAYPAHIGAIHRVVPGLAAPIAAELAKSAFTVRPLPGGTANLPAALTELACAARHGTAFVLAGDGQAYLITDPDPVQLDAAMPGARSRLWRGLAAAVLQELLLRRVWAIPDDDAHVRVVHQDAAAAIAAAAEPPSGTAVICTPMSAADVYAVAAGGERVPRKSTSFGPKPRTGLVIRTFAQG